MSSNVYLKDVNGNWYELEESVLKEKGITQSEAWEAIAAEAAAKRKRIVELLEQMDDADHAIMRDLLFERTVSNAPAMANRGLQANTPGRFGRVQGPNRACDVCDCDVIYPDAGAQPAMPPWERMRWRYGRTGGMNQPYDDVCDYCYDAPPPAPEQPAVDRYWNRLRNLRHYR